jgi:hypothetical protein
MLFLVVSAPGEWKVEARVVSFTTGDDRYLPEIVLGRCGRILLLTSMADSREFFVDKQLVLAFRYTISVDDNVICVKV